MTCIENYNIMKLAYSEISRLWPIARRRICTLLVNAVQRLFGNETLKRDVFGSAYSRRALVCYLPEVFGNGEIPKYHSNFTECYTAAKVLHRLGYCVDCASRGKQGIDYSPYEVVYGISCPSYMASFASRPDIHPLRIFYSVGAHTFYNFEVTAKRNMLFNKEHGCWLTGSSHYIPGNGLNYYAAHFSDAVICLGDDFVTRKFQDEDSRPGHYRTLPAFYFDVQKPDEKKDFMKCRNNILWFGSSGMLHKGLDIAIDFALAHKQFTLHICGGSRQEKDFWNYYMPRIEAVDNIVMHGFVDICSDDFRNILGNCAILLNPSLSESGAVSVLNVLGNGMLVPVYSSGTALDLSEVGVEVPDVTYASFEKALLEVALMPVEQLAQKAAEAHHLVRRKYTLERYEENLYNHIREIIEKNRQ